MKPRQLVIDQLATILRKPTAAPLLTPAEAVSIALSSISSRWSGQLLSDTAPPVRIVLKALHDAGYKIVPR